MASIEKIWGTSRQYNELTVWLEQHKPEYLQYLSDGNHDAGASIALFPEDADLWLLKNCPIDWLIYQICNQHGYTLGSVNDLIEVLSELDIRELGN